VNSAGLPGPASRRLLLQAATGLSSLLSSVWALAQPQAVNGASEIEKLMVRLRKGDSGAVAELAALGPSSYQPLAKELQKPVNRISEWLALQALAQLADRRTILLIARKSLESGEDEFTSGEYDAYIDSYLRSIVGTTFSSFDGYERWYEKNKDKLIWDATKKRFRVR
jgi:hypothetical protein